MHVYIHAYIHVCILVHTYIQNVHVTLCHDIDSPFNILLTWKTPVYKSECMSLFVH